MNKLTFTIKSNDEVTLKYNLQRYVKRIQGRFGGTLMRLRETDPTNCCKDPQYIAHWPDLLLFRGLPVKIMYTCIKQRVDNDCRPIGAYCYIKVTSHSGNECEFPLEFIDKSHCLKRNGKRISLHNKTLICGE